MYRIRVASQQFVDYLNPTPESIVIEDIAKALSREGRFANHTKFHYSVGQHSLYACGLAPHNLKLEALLHDAEEAYIKDLPSPLAAALSRGMVAQYEFIKKKFKKVIRDKFQLNWTEEGYKIIKEIDLRLAVTEKNALYRDAFQFSLCWNGGRDVEPYKLQIIPESMIKIEEKFLQMFELYRRDKGEKNV